MGIYQNNWMILVYLVLSLVSLIILVLSVFRRNYDATVTQIICIPFLLMGLADNLYSWVMPAIYDQIRFFMRWDIK